MEIVKYLSIGTKELVVHRLYCIDIKILLFCFLFEGLFHRSAVQITYGTKVLAHSKRIAAVVGLFANVQVVQGLKLLTRDVNRVLVDHPLDTFRARWCGQRALVGPIVGRVGWKQFCVIDCFLQIGFLTFELYVRQSFDYFVKFRIMLADLKIKKAFT